MTDELINQFQRCLQNSPGYTGSVEYIDVATICTLYTLGIQDNVLDKILERRKKSLLRAAYPTAKLCPCIHRTKIDWDFIWLSLRTLRTNSYNTFDANYLTCLEVEES